MTGDCQVRISEGRRVKLPLATRPKMENIAKAAVKYKAYRAYGTTVYHYVVPGVGKLRLDKIGPQHFEWL